MMVVHIKSICRVHDAILIDLLVDLTRLCPCWLLLHTHLITNYKCDLNMIHSCSSNDHVNYFSTYILSLIIMVYVGGS